MSSSNAGVEVAERRRPVVPIVIAGFVLSLLVLGGVLVHHVESKTNHVPLSAAPKPVTARAAESALYRPSRSYIGTIEPWSFAKIGPQFVSAYVSEVRVRPGAVVKRGDVLATLDCRNANATSQAVAMQTRALEAQQVALAHEAERMQNLQRGGFISPNELEQKLAQSSARKAQLMATEASGLRAALEVNDCVLRAPFDAEVSARSADPGTFVRPGSSIVSLVDRRVLRICADVPEVDYQVVAPGAQIQIHVVATGRDLTAPIARRAPAADSGTRTVHFEIDVPDEARAIPVGTTAELRIDVGAPEPATEIPLAAAAVRGDKASLFVVDHDVARARTLHVMGEIGGKLYLARDLVPGTPVVLDGRALLEDGDHIHVALEAAPPLSDNGAPKSSAHGS
jgi:RND family efflux transporter MFP subunit